MGKNHFFQFKSPEEVVEITDETEKFDYLRKVLEEIFIYGERRNKIVAIQYMNGITVYYIKATTFSDWYLFLDRGELVISDALALQKYSKVDLKINNSSLIEVTDSNSTHYTVKILM